jgi:UDP-N-acetylglucosamine 4,6-dehydratase
MFAGKTLAITGGTGSFGNAILKRMLTTDLAEIRIFSRDEKKQEDMRLALNDRRLRFYIGDVRDIRAVRNLMEGVDFVFHAAALKQVPSCEFFPMEAIKTNVLGSENAMDAAIAAGVSRFVLLSTDKAVYPINAMGLSKALAEKVLLAKARGARPGMTVLSATRYGNVMASRGSVIPLFVEQIKAGKPLTITDPKMTRFLMSLDESVDLVLAAFEDAEPGDIFVQKSSASTIEALVRALLRIFKADNPVKVIGTRHSEKLYESLVSREEMSRARVDEKYFRIKMDDRDLNYEKYFTEGQKEISTFEDYTSHNTDQMDVSQVEQMLRKLDFIKQALND